MRRADGASISPLFANGTGNPQVSVVDPHLSPVAGVAARRDHGGDREGDPTSMPNGFDWRSRRIHFNAPAQRPMKTCTPSWHAPVLYLAILRDLVLYAIALVFRGRFSLLPGSCHFHASQHPRATPVGVGVGIRLASVIGLFAAFALDAMRTGVARSVLAMVSLLGTATHTRLVVPPHVDPRGAPIQGLARPLLSSLGPTRPR